MQFELEAGETLGCRPAACQDLPVARIGLELLGEAEAYKWGPVCSFKFHAMTYRFN